MVQQSIGILSTVVSRPQMCRLWQDMKLCSYWEVHDLTSKTIPSWIFYAMMSVPLYQITFLFSNVHSTVQFVVCYVHIALTYAFLFVCSCCWVCQILGSKMVRHLIVEIRFHSQFVFGKLIIDRWQTFHSRTHVSLFALSHHTVVFSLGLFPIQKLKIMNA